MTLRMRILVIILMILSIIYVVNKIKTKKVSYKYGIGWIVVACVIMIFSIFPVLLDGLSSLLGVYSPANMLFFFGFILMTLVTFSLSVSVSALSDKVKQLSQELAISKKDSYDRDQEIMQGKADENKDENAKY